MVAVHCRAPLPALSTAIAGSGMEKSANLTLPGLGVCIARTTVDALKVKCPRKRPVDAATLTQEQRQPWMLPHLLRYPLNKPAPRLLQDREYISIPDDLYPGYDESTARDVLNVLDKGGTINFATLQQVVLKLMQKAMLPRVLDFAYIGSSRVEGEPRESCPYLDIVR